MLVFTTQKDGEDYVYVTWKGGENFPIVENPNDFVSMAANEGELELIKQIFPTFPHPSTNIAIYPGDIGRFIYLNLRVFVNQKQ